MSENGGLTLEPRDDFSLDEINWLEDRLYEHNRAATGRGDGLGLGFAVRDRAGALIGAAAGYTWAGMCELKQVWVDPGHRGQGLGRRLVEAVIAEAARRGCSAIFLASYSFQAPGLYERCGFERVAEVADFPPGHSNVILRRRLSPRPGPER